MKLARIKNGIVSDIIDFGTESIPTWSSNWIDATDLEMGMVDDGHGNYSHPVIPDPSPEMILSAKKYIDNYAGKTRIKYITDAPGQDLTYKQKAEEAEKYVTAVYPSDLTGYPFIQAEINAYGKTKEQAADDILTKRDQWLSVGAQIEEVRLQTKQQIDNAVSNSEIKTICETAVTNFDAI